ncbi:hypothetical protein BH09MYX1_BH09MYX1_21210 [soil metagenome]
MLTRVTSPLPSPSPIPTPPPPPGPALQDLDNEGDRSSVTDVNGTVARFEMAYSPEAETGRVPFGAPLTARIPSYIFLALALGVVGTVALAHVSSPGSSLFIWVVEGDKGRPLPSTVLAFIVLVSGIATALRAHMRGVVVHRDGIEARYLLPMGVPKIRKWAWAQIHRIVLDDDGVMLELWDGQYDRLPDVDRGTELAKLLEGMGGRHNVMVTRLKELG